MTEVDNVTAAYDAVYAGLTTSPTLRRIWRDTVLGDDYPRGFEHLSFITLGEMQRIADALQIRSAGVVVDLGCGAGGPGLWVARESNARLIGIDASSVAIAQARARADDLGLSSTATFSSGYFDQLALGEESTDVVMSIDALQYAPNKAAAFAEAARILRPGARLVFTAFEVDAERSAGLPVFGVDPVSDFRPVLERGAFSVERYEETAGWCDRVTSAYKAVLAERTRVEQEMGTFAAAALAFEITATLDRQIFRRRVLGTAVRTAVNPGSANRVSWAWEELRAWIALDNARRRLFRNPFRTFVHPAAAMETILTAAGFHRVGRQRRLVWCVDVYTRVDGRRTGTVKMNTDWGGSKSEWGMERNESPTQVDVLDV